MTNNYGPEGGISKEEVVTTEGQGGFLTEELYQAEIDLLESILREKQIHTLWGNGAQRGLLPCRIFFCYLIQGLLAITRLTESHKSIRDQTLEASKLLPLYACLSRKLELFTKLRPESRNFCT